MVSPFKYDDVDPPSTSANDNRMRPTAARMSEYEALLACYKSGQISDRAWGEHLRDDVFRRWLERREMNDALRHRADPMPVQGETTHPVDRGAWLLKIAGVKWVKVARIYFGVLMLEKMRVGHDLSREEQDRLWNECALSIQELVVRGLLELQGDPSCRRHAEIRLTAAAFRDRYRSLL